ncbi:hypothetical protein CC80DRAFT_143315 [Byssothecium circinans]|uniref:RING-type domain-containing protein n=1 Tax=Byssothecium circinans TaxID=147558 RepID=A0A6A5TPP0_9PLEO|nr:hypothetical protein CC80DRAFT_143315 [Byssothecium circinans]
MLVRGLQQLTCALVAMLATVNADIQSSSVRPNVSFGGQQPLLLGQNRRNLTNLVPMTEGARTTNDFNGLLVLTTDSNFQNISSGAIPLISCDRYNGNIQVQNVFQSVHDNKNPLAAIFYSTTVDYCNYSDPTEQIRSFPMYSMTSASTSQQLVNMMENRSYGSGNLDVTVQRDAGSSSSASNNNGNNNPLGPSPSTAVAMIILYSITGIITALFLVIIVTGAVRAHRHPDRYGPRDVLGRPRQSRARGLGRAILDTLPIVKFGEKEPPKPTDVELGSVAEARAVENDTAATATATPANAETGEEHAATGVAQARDEPETEASRDANAQQQREGLDGGIAPAQSVATAAGTAQNENDNGLGCSICTEDFEKGQDIRVLPCNHKFHPDCVDPWLLNVSGTCPLCRVDLRPVTSNTSTDQGAEGNPDLLAPPLQTDNDPAHRRRSGLRDILSFRTRPNSSPDERISALRRLREQRRNGSGEAVTDANASAEDVASGRRSNRMSARLSGVFGNLRRGREESPQPPTTESSAAQQPTSSGEQDAGSSASGHLTVPGSNQQRSR